MQIDKVLAYEIKKDIADRYFGFRKLIEEDKQDLEEKINQYSFILEKRISFDLVRLYILLKDEELIMAFLNLTPFDENFYYDRHLMKSEPIRQRVFEGIRVRGLFRASKFTNLFSDCYEHLYENTSKYRDCFEELEELNATIAEEIKLFYKKNDLGTILGFLRSLNSHTASSLDGGVEIGMTEGLEKKMAIDIPLPIEHYLPVISPMSDLDEISQDLKKLIKQAYKLHCEESLDFFTSKKEKADRLTS